MFLKYNEYYDKMLHIKYIKSQNHFNLICIQIRNFFNKEQNIFERLGPIFNIYARLQSCISHGNKLDYNIKVSPVMAGQSFIPKYFTTNFYCVNKQKVFECVKNVSFSAVKIAYPI